MKTWLGKKNLETQEVDQHKLPFVCNRLIMSSLHPFGKSLKFKMHERSKSIIVVSNLATKAHVLSKYIYYCWLYPFAKSLDFFINTFPFSSSLLWKIHLVSITILDEGLRISSETLFLSKWFKSSCIAWDQCLSMRASLTSFASILETNILRLLTSLKECWVMIPLKISPMTF